MTTAYTFDADTSAGINPWRMDCDAPGGVGAPLLTMDNGLPVGSIMSSTIANPVIGIGDWSDSATLTCAQALSITPVTNLQTIQPTDITRTSGTSATIVADRGSQQYFNRVSTLFTNTTSAATWRIRASNTIADLTGTPLFDSGIMTFWASDTLDDRRHSLLFLSGSILAQYIQIDISDPTNPDGFLSLGRLFIDDAWQSTRNFSYGVGIGFIDRSTLTRSKSGGLTFPTGQPAAPTISGKIAFLSEDEVLTNMYEIERVCGTSKDVLLITNPVAGTHRHKKIIYGLLTKLAPIVNTNFGLFDVEIDVEGLL